MNIIVLYSRLILYDQRKIHMGFLDNEQYCVILEIRMLIVQEELGILHMICNCVRRTNSGIARLQADETKEIRG